MCSSLFTSMHNILISRPLYFFTGIGNKFRPDVDTEKTVNLISMYYKVGY